MPIPEYGNHESGATADAYSWISYVAAFASAEARARHINRVLEEHLEEHVEKVFESVSLALK